MDRSGAELDVNAVLQGAEDPALRVGVRWEGYMNRKISYQDAGGADWNSGLPATWAMEAEADSHNLKIALLAAIMIHILLLWVIFPGGSTAMGTKLRPVKEPPVRIILKAPPEDPLDILVIKEHSALVPVPDPTPLDPEPPVSVTAITASDVPDSDFYYDPTVPEIKTVDKDTEGLINPVYEVAQLQRNVVYPPLGIKARMQGYVVVQAVLNRDGTVSDVKVIGGTLNGLGFPEAAEMAVRKLRFSPGTIYGNPVNVVMRLTIHFRLR